MNREEIYGEENYNEIMVAGLRNVLNLNPHPYWYTEDMSDKRQLEFFVDDNPASIFMQARELGIEYEDMFASDVLQLIADKYAEDLESAMSRFYDLTFSDKWHLLTDVLYVKPNINPKFWNAYYYLYAQALEQVLNVDDCVRRDEVVSPFVYTALAKSTPRIGSSQYTAYVDQLSQIHIRDRGNIFVIETNFNVRKYTGCLDAFQEIYLLKYLLHNGSIMKHFNLRMSEQNVEYWLRNLNDDDDSDVEREEWEPEFWPDSDDSGVGETNSEPSSEESEYTTSDSDSDMELHVTSLDLNPKYFRGDYKTLVESGTLAGKIKNFSFWLSGRYKKFLIDEAVSVGIGASMLALHPDVPTAILVLLQHLHRVLDLKVLVPYIMDYCKKVASHINLGGALAHFSTPENHTDGASSDLRVTSLDEGTFALTNIMDGIISFLKSSGESAPAMISVVAGIVFAAVSATMAKHMYSAEKADSVLKRLGSVGRSFAGAKMGMSAFIDVASSIPEMVKESITWLVGTQENNKLMAIVRTWDIADEGEFEKAKLPEMCEYLVDPKNIFEIQGSAEKKRMMDLVFKLLNEIHDKQSNVGIGLGRESVAWMANMKGIIRNVRSQVYRYNENDGIRPVPMWIYIQGDAGCGKSQASNELAPALNAMAFNDGIPGYGSDPANVSFAMNVSDKFMPGYRGQKVLLIDDVFQDSSATSDNSSAMRMISFVSGVPHKPNQASLDEKGMDFNSEVIITTSNIEVPDRKEIQSKEALLSRIRIYIKMLWHPNVCEACRKERGVTICAKCREFDDPWFKRPVQFKICKFNQQYQNLILCQTMDWISVVTYCYTEFKAFRQNQIELVNRVRLGSPLVEEIQRRQGELRTTSLVLLGGALCASAVPLKLAWDVYNDNNTDFVNIWKKCKRHAHNQRLVKYAPLCLAEIQQSVDEGPYGGRWIVNEERQVVGLLESRSDFSWDYRKTAQALNSVWNGELKPYQTQFQRMDNFVKAYLQDQQSMHANLLKASSKELDKAFASWKGSVVSHVLDAFLAGIVGYAGLRIVTNLCGGSNAVTATSVKYASGPQRPVPQRVVVNTRPVRPTALDICSDTNASELINTLTNRISVCKIFTQTQNKKFVGTCVRIRGSWILTNAHYFEGIESGSVFTVFLSSDSGVKEVKQCFEKDNLMVYSDDEGNLLDVALYKCDSSMPMAKDITDQFLDNETELESTECAIMKAFPHRVIEANRHAIMKNKKKSYTGRTGTVKYSSVELIEVEAPTRDGESGSLLVACNKRYKRKLMGIQTCTDGVHSYFVPVTSEMLNLGMDDDYVSDVDGEDLKVTCGVIPSTDVHPTLGANGLMYYGYTPGGRVISSPKNSKLRPSLVHDSSKITQEPAVLADGDERMDEEYRGKSVLFRNLEGFDKPLGVVRRSVLLIAVAWLSAWYSVVGEVRNLKRRLLTDDEMVNGYDDYLKQLDMRTSPGYPYVLERCRTDLRGKFEWFIERVEDTGKKMYTACDSLLSKIKEREDMAKIGKRVPTLAYANLKDETRTCDKIKKGKTRVFLCMPQDYNLLVRKYFGMFTVMMHIKAARDIAPCVGVDPCRGWTALVRRLKSVGSNFEDFDYSGWDTMIHPELMDGVADVVNAWYDDGPVNAMVRRTLMRELAMTWIIAKNRVFMKTSGQVSGCAITAEGNSIINELLMIYCWIILSREFAPEMESMDEYQDNCQIGVYGDDIVKSVSDEAKWFNGNNIKHIIKELGMNITTGDKTENFGFIGLDSLSFLKRSFVPLKYGEYTAPLREDVIENITQWIHDSDCPAASTNLNIRTAARNYALWGREKYDAFCRNMNRKIVSLVNSYPEIKPLTETYEKAMAEIYAEHIIPSQGDFLCMI